MTHHQVTKLKNTDEDVDTENNNLYDVTHNNKTVNYDVGADVRLERLLQIITESYLTIQSHIISEYEHRAISAQRKYTCRIKEAKGNSPVHVARLHDVTK